jgi:uncharacterized protein YheU (UPF0270 family)
MRIPPEHLNPDTLTALVKEWLMREGEDWALNSRPLDQAVDDALAAVKRGTLLITWHAQTESFNLVSAEDYNEE